MTHKAVESSQPNSLRGDHKCRLDSSSRILGSPIPVALRPSKAPLRMNLSFASNEEDDILNTTIQDSETGSVVYMVETPKHVGGILTTTVMGRDQFDGSIRFAFQILWKGSRGSVEDVKVVLNFRTFEEVPVRDVLGNAPGSTT